MIIIIIIITWLWYIMAISKCSGILINFSHEWYPECKLEERYDYINVSFSHQRERGKTLRVVKRDQATSRFADVWFQVWRENESLNLSAYPVSLFIPALNFDLSEFLQCKRSTNDQTLKKIHTRNNYDKLFVVTS